MKNKNNIDAVRALEESYLASAPLWAAVMQVPDAKQAFYSVMDGFYSDIGIQERLARFEPLLALMDYKPFSAYLAEIEETGLMTSVDFWVFFSPKLKTKNYTFRQIKEFLDLFKSVLQPIAAEQRGKYLELLWLLLNSSLELKSLKNRRHLFIGHLIIAMELEGSIDQLLLTRSPIIEAVLFKIAELRNTNVTLNPLTIRNLAFSIVQFYRIFSEKLNQRFSAEMVRSILAKNAQLMFRLWLKKKNKKFEAYLASLTFFNKNEEEFDCSLKQLWFYAYPVAFFIRDYGTDRSSLLKGHSLRHLSNDGLVLTKKAAHAMSLLFIKHQPDANKNSLNYWMLLSIVLGEGFAITEAEQLANLLNRVPGLNNHVYEIIDFVKKQNVNVQDYTLGAFLDFLNYKWNEEPTFSLKGRTYAAINRQQEEWHQQMQLSRRLGNYVNSVWKGLPLEDLIIEHEEETYLCTQLKSAKALFHEGAMMNHCVAGYAHQCLTGHSTIWSLRQKMENESEKTLLTIQMQAKSMVQIRGRYNARATSKQMEILAIWAEKYGLRIADR